MTTLVVNGRMATVDSDADTPLPTVLRDELGLVGTRFGCGQRLCDACFVTVDGTVTPACQTPLWQVADTEVRTVEVLARDGRRHPVQQAVLDRQAAQCGVCLSGILVCAAALLDTEPEADADAARVSVALAGNLCRCGAHRRIVDAVLAAIGSTGPGIPGGPS